MQFADKRKYHYIYKITRVDGKYYIGMHSTDSLEDGYFGSGKLITRSITKYGKEIHSKEILEFLDSRTSLKEREKQVVNEEIVKDPLCMNLRIGGDGWDSKEASAVAAKGNLSVKRDKIGAAAKGLKTRLERGTQYIPNPRTLGMLGKKHSTFSKKKMAYSGSGEKNSQFGTCWVIFSGSKPIKIKKEKLDEYIQNGYIRGRK